MDNVPPATRDALRADILLAQTTVAAGVVPSRIKKPNEPGTSGVRFAPPSMQTLMFRRWPILSHSSKPLAFDGAMAASHPAKEPNRSRSVEDAIRLVSQKFPSMGSKDPRLDESGKQDFRLRRMYSAWTKEDDPPSRVEPVPMLILLRAAEFTGPSARDQATIDCIWMAFYYLLRPGD